MEKKIFPYSLSLYYVLYSSFVSGPSHLSVLATTEISHMSYFLLKKILHPLDCLALFLSTVCHFVFLGKKTRLLSSKDVSWRAAAIYSFSRADLFCSPATSFNQIVKWIWAVPLCIFLEEYDGEIGRVLST